MLCNTTQDKTTQDKTVRSQRKAHTQPKLLASWWKEGAPDGQVHKTRHRGI